MSKYFNLVVISVPEFGNLRKFFCQKIKNIFHLLSVQAQDGVLVEIIQ